MSLEESLVIQTTGRLNKIGFALDESRGHRIFKREFSTEVKGTRCEIHALPENEWQTRFTVEVWNWQDEVDKPQASALPGEYTIDEVARLIAIISGRRLSGSLTSSLLPHVCRCSNI